MRRASRVDANQRAIVLALRRAGASVQLLHTVGAGCPDLAVGFRGENYLLECKTPAGQLTPAEREWHAQWRGQRAVVRSADEALRAIGAME